MSILRVDVAAAGYAGDALQLHSRDRANPESDSIDFYLVLEEFRGGPSFRETDEGITYIKLIDDLLTGQYDNVLRVVAFNPVEGWSRDASEDVANALEQHIAAEGREVSETMRDFIEGQTGRKIGQQLSLL